MHKVSALTFRQSLVGDHFRAAFTIARMPALIASGSSGQAAMMAQERPFSHVPRVRVQDYPPDILAYSKAPAPGRVARREWGRGGVIDVMAACRLEDLGLVADQACRSCWSC
jgi:hypothetical protein